MSKKQQVQINRMIEALEMIADMPVWQDGVSLDSLNSQYDEARAAVSLICAAARKGVAHA